MTAGHCQCCSLGRRRRACLTAALAAAGEPVSPCSSHRAPPGTAPAQRWTAHSHARTRTVHCKEYSTWGDARTEARAHSNSASRGEFNMRRRSPCACTVRRLRRLASSMQPRMPRASLSHPCVSQAPPRFPRQATCRTPDSSATKQHGHRSLNRIPKHLPGIYTVQSRLLRCSATGLADS